jgi:hypothetical protein
MLRDSGFAGRVGAPLQRASGAWVPAVVAQTLQLAQYDSATASWSPPPDSTGIVSLSDNQISSAPSLAITDAADPVMAFAVRTPMGSSFRFTYAFTRRVAGVWSAQAAIAGATAPVVSAEIALVRRATSNEIVAVWNSGSMYGTGLFSAVYSAGAWSAAIPVVTDVAAGVFRTFAVVPLADGRVALAYLSSTLDVGLPTIRAGLFVGSAWTPFTRVPVARVGAASIPIGMVRSVDGAAVLDLVWLDSDHHAEHSRLTDVAGWTWTPPAVVDAVSIYDCVAIAAGP